MPFISTIATVKIDENKEAVIKGELGQIITEIPGKTEEWLMITLSGQQPIYFRGEKCDKAAFVNIKIFGTADRKSKEALTRKVSELLERELSIPKAYVYITIDEVKDWAWNGQMF